MERKWNPYGTCNPENCPEKIIREPETVVKKTQRSKKN
jgi:hypothetical protein